MTEALIDNLQAEHDRKTLKSRFLINNGFENYTITDLPADASFRTYSRLVHGDESYILMNCPPEYYSLQPFIKVGNHLLNQGFSVPKIFQYDHTNGFMILEDLGDMTINNLLKKEDSPLSEKEIYQKITKLLSRIQACPLLDDLVNYSNDTLIKESETFLDWFLPISNGEQVSENSREQYRNAWGKIFKYINLPPCLLLKDYHADNLMYLQDREGLNQIGLLDFQDALIGSPAYDLVSLLEDARRDVPKSIAAEMINYYLSLTFYNRKDFLAEYSIFGAQRNLRILGYFARKATRDKNSKYLSFVPRVKKHLDNNLTHPLLAPLKEWLIKVTN